MGIIRVFERGIEVMGKKRRKKSKLKAEKEGRDYNNGPERGMKGSEGRRKRNGKKKIRVFEKGSERREGRGGERRTKGKRKRRNKNVFV